MRRSGRCARALGAAIVLTLLAWMAAPGESHATAIVRIVPSSSTMAVGLTQAVEIRADLSQAVLGFGLDLYLDPALLRVVGLPAVGPLFLPLFAPDGDGLAGLADAGPISGSDVLLASVQIQALAPGTATIVASLTAGDLTEGFPLDPAGFESDIQFVGAAVVAVPELGTGWATALLAALMICRRHRSRERSHSR